MEKKYGKDKAIGIFVGKTQESVRLIDGKSAAQIMFEKLQEHQNKEENQMKKLTIEYQGYKLEIEIIPTNPHCYPIIKGTCDAISFTKKGYYGNYQDIMDEFMKAVDREYLLSVDDNEQEARNEALAILD